MTHTRKAIRDAIVAAVTGLATTGTKVSSTRLFDYGLAELPALNVYATEESSDVDDMGDPRDLMRTLTLMVEAYDSATGAMDDRLDVIAEEIEAAMGTRANWPVAAQNVVLKATSIGVDGEAEKATGVLQLNYTIDYITPQNDSTTAL